MLDKIRKIHLADAVLCCVILLGCYARLVHIDRYTLWFDEAWVVELSQQPLAEIFSSNRPVPKLFALNLKLIISIFGSGNIILHLTPILFSIASMLLFAIFMRRFFSQDPWLTVLATSLFAFNSISLTISNEVKQYSSDIFFTLLIILLTEYFVSRIKSYWHILGIAAFFFISFLYSYTAVLVAPVFFVRWGVDVVYNYRKKSHNLLEQSRFFFITFIIILLVFCFVYSFFYNARSQYLMDRWVYAFPENITSTISLLNFYLNQRTISVLGYFFKYSFFLKYIEVLAIFFFLGCFTLIWFGQAVRIYLFIPFISALGASALRLYPYGERAASFLMPMFFIFLSYGLYIVFAKYFRSWVRGVICVALSIFILWPSLNRNFDYSRSRQDLRPVINYWKQSRLVGDRLFVARYLSYSFSLYSKDSNGVIFGQRYREHSTYREIFASAQNQSGRLWIMVPTRFKNVGKHVHSQIQGICRKLDEQRAPAIALFLYECEL